MKSLPITNVQPFMPHGDKMMCLESILNYDLNGLMATASIDESSIFVENKQFPAWAALELMAQGVAAWAGCLADDNGEPVRLGFLLGSRKTYWYFDSLTAPCQVLIKVTVSHQEDSGFGIFDAELWLSDENLKATDLLAKAALNVYSPKEELPLNE